MDIFVATVLIMFSGFAIVGMIIVINFLVQIKNYFEDILGMQKTSIIIGDKYAVTIKCNNCGYNKKYILKKGELVSDTNCPWCGCKTLEPDLGRYTFAVKQQRD